MGYCQSLPVERIGWLNDPPRSFLANKKPVGTQIELWKKVASKLQIQYQLIKYNSLKRLLSDIRTGQIDGAIGGFTITPGRLNQIRFTIPTETANYSVYQLEDNLPFASLALKLISSRQAVTAYLVFIGILLVLIIPAWKWEKETGRPIPASGTLHEFIYFSQQILLSSSSYATRSRTRVLTIVTKIFTQTFFAAVFATLALINVGTIMHKNGAVSIGSLNFGLRSVGVLSGSFLEVALKNQHLKIVECESTQRCLWLLKNQKIAAAILDDENAFFACRLTSCTGISNQSLKFASQPNSWMIAQASALFERINEINIVISQDYQNGVLNQLKAKYFAFQAK